MRKPNPTKDSRKREYKILSTDINNYQMRRTNIKQAIKEYFFVNPTSRLRVREIERTLKLPLPSVIRYCKELEKEGILRVEKNRKRYFLHSR